MKLVHIGGGNAFDMAARRALNWSFKRSGERPPDIRREPRGKRTFEDEAGQVDWAAYLDGAARVLQVRLQHPDSDDPTLTWQATTTVSEFNGLTRATVRLERGAKVHIVRPAALSLHPPALTTELMKPPLLAYVGSLELRPGVKTIDAVDAASFVDDIIRAPERALPVVVAAHDVRQRLVQAMARDLSGLALVTRGQDGAADEAIRLRLRHDGLDVPAKGVRLFWPGIGTPGVKLRHPYWTRRQIAFKQHDKPAIVNRLVKLLAPISTGRVPADPAVLEARREQLRMAARPQPRRDRPKKRAPSAVAHAGDVDKLREQVADLAASLTNAESERDAANLRVAEVAASELQTIDEAMKIQEQNSELSEQVASLTAELEDHKENVALLTRYVADQTDEDDVDAAPEPAPTTWSEVRSRLSSLESPGFEFTDTALKCASDKARYPHADTMWDSLERLARVGHLYNERGGDLGMRFEDFATQVGGLDVALQDSEYEESCFFEYEGRSLSRLPHVKIDDAKSPNEVGRIYFAIDSQASRLVVDWFGTKPDRPITTRAAAAS